MKKQNAIKSLSVTSSLNYIIKYNTALNEKETTSSYYIIYSRRHEYRLLGYHPSVTAIQVRTTSAHRYSAHIPPYDYI